MYHPIWSEKENIKNLWWRIKDKDKKVLEIKALKDKIKKRENEKWLENTLIKVNSIIDNINFIYFVLDFYNI